MRLVAALVAVISIGACNGAPAPLDARPDAPDLGLDRGRPDAERPDLAAWVGCVDPIRERVCQPFAGDPCCPRPASSLCPPGWTCQLVDCPTGSPDGGCPAGSFCRSRGTCSCIPAMGGPCPCGGTCLASCSAAAKCAW